MRKLAANLSLPAIRCRASQEDLMVHLTFQCQGLLHAALMALSAFFLSCSPKPGESHQLQESVLADPALDRILKWARVVEFDPNEEVVRDPAAIERIRAQQLPWRVEELESGVIFLLVPPGDDILGLSEHDEWARTDEPRPHTATFSVPFYLGETEVTQEQWSRILPNNPSYFLGNKRPVDGVSWGSDQLSIDHFLNETGFRLPTELEWEYACRAGSDGARYGPLLDVAWFFDNAQVLPVGVIASNLKPGSFLETHEVGLLRPNAWGFFDMLGNVEEWCTASFDDQGQALSSGQIDEPLTDGFRALRGGHHYVDESYIRATSRTLCPPKFADRGIGFRVARDI